MLLNSLMLKKLPLLKKLRQDQIAVKVDDDKSLRRTNIAKERIKLRENSRVKEIISHIPKEYTKNKT